AVGGHRLEEEGVGGGVFAGHWWIEEAAIGGAAGGLRRDESPSNGTIRVRWWDEASAVSGPIDGHLAGMK
ncbi:hypothetical protein AVEN_165484-1, partial [Araneus ventricosus]